MNTSSHDQSGNPEAHARWVDVSPRSAYAADAYFVSPQGRVLGEIAPAVEFGYETKIEGERFGRYVDKSAAMLAVEREVQARHSLKSDSAADVDLAALLVAIRQAGFMAVKTAHGVVLMRAGEIHALGSDLSQSRGSVQASSVWGQPAVVPRVGGACFQSLPIADAGFALSDERVQAASRWTVERHGKGWAIYTGRDNHHHGANWGQLSECDESLAKLVERGLNAIGQTGQAPG